MQLSLPPGNPEVEARKRAVHARKSKTYCANESSESGKRSKREKQRAQASRRMLESYEAGSTSGSSTESESIDLLEPIKKERRTESMACTTRDAMRKNKSKTTAGKQFLW